MNLVRIVGIGKDDEIENVLEASGHELSPSFQHCNLADIPIYHFQRQKSVVYQEHRFIYIQVKKAEHRFIYLQFFRTDFN